MMHLQFKAAYYAAFLLFIMVFGVSSFANTSLVNPITFQCYRLDSERVKVEVFTLIEYDSIVIKTAKGSRLRYQNPREGSIKFTLSDDQFPLKVKAQAVQGKDDLLLDNQHLLDGPFILDTQCKKSRLPK